MKVKRLLASFLAASLTFSMSATAFAASGKTGSEGAKKGTYEFSKDTVYFDVKGNVRDIYDVNADTQLTKKVGTFAGATEYFITKDTEVKLTSDEKSRFFGWVDFKTGEYYLANDVELIPNVAAVWSAKFKAPTTAVEDTNTVDGTAVKDAIEASKVSGSVVLGNALYAVEAEQNKMNAPVAQSSGKIELDAEAKKDLEAEGKPVVLSTGVASLTLPANALVDSFMAKVTAVNESVAGLTSAVKYDLTVNGKGHKFDSAVEVSLPITLPEGEKDAFVYYIDEKGNLKERYDAKYENGVLTFSTTHFSTYAISTEKKEIAGDNTPSGGGGSSSGGSSSSGSSDSTKPSVTVNGEGGKVNVDNKGNVAIIPSTGYRVKDVTVNGKSVGAVESLTGLKSTDKVVVTFEKIEEVNPVDPANPFADVAKGAWYYDAVRFAYENKLFSGITSTKFGPDQSMTRAMLVTVLYRHSGSAEAGTSSFKDVAADAYYANAVAWAEKNKIVTGIDATTFAPNKNITREQIAAILNRYAKFSGKNLPTGTLNFSDAAQISEYAKADVATMQAAGIVNGRNGNVFAPKASATRAEVATMIMRYIKSVG